VAALTVGKATAVTMEADSTDAGLLATLRTEFSSLAQRLQICGVGTQVVATARGTVTVLPVAAALGHVLAQAQPLSVNDRLCVQGTEPFVWSAAAMGAQAGLAPIAPAR